MASICYKIFAFPCEMLGKCCWCCEKGCEKAFGSVLGCAGEDRPSPLFLTYTIWFTLPIAALSLWAGFDANAKGCSMFIPPIVWAFVLAACCFFFIFFAIRVYVTMSRPYDAANAEARAAEEGRPVTDNDQAHGSFRQRIWYTACNDPITFAYFLIFPFTFIWVTLGLSEINGENGGIDGCRTVSILLWILSTATYVYLIGTFIVASISMCWEGKRVADLKKAQKNDPNAAVPTANLAHLFAPNFGAGHGKPKPNQAPAQQQMAAPVGTAITGVPAAAPPTAPAEQQQGGIMGRIFGS